MKIIIENSFHFGLKIIGPDRMRSFGPVIGDEDEEAAIQFVDGRFELVVTRSPFQGGGESCRVTLDETFLAGEQRQFKLPLSALKAELGL